MALRTPRRRISPRTKRRYRAIKGFFRRTLGSASQQGIDITSSIALNINKQKNGLYPQLHEANKHSHEICDDIPEGEPQTAISSNGCRYETRQDDLEYGTKLKRVETKIKYPISAHHYKKSDNRGSGKAKDERNNAVHRDMALFDDNNVTYSPKNKIVDDVKPSYVDTYFQKYRTHSLYDSFTSAVTASSFHSLNEFNKPLSDLSNTIYEEKINCIKRGRNEYNDNNEEYKETNGYLDKMIHQTRKYNEKPSSKDLDEDFIADIIQRQYKPVKFGRKISDLSQFSAPECHDKIFFDDDQQMQPLHKNHRHMQIFATDHNPALQLNHHRDHNDSDQELYNYNKKYRKQRKKHTTNYNDSNIYDVIPIKEKTSPKSRRKFLQDNMAYAPTYKERLCKEIPPSPETHRPKFNLKVQNYSEFDTIDNIHNARHSRRTSPKRHNKGHHEHYDGYDHFMQPRRRISPKRALQKHIIEQDSENMKHLSMRTSPKYVERYEDSNENHCINENLDENIRKIYQNMESYSIESNMKHDSDAPKDTICSFPYPVTDNNHNVQMMEPFFDTQGATPLEKTDKALCEIKDILQDFLQEIKESPLSGQSGANTKNEKGFHFKPFGELPNMNSLNNNGTQHPITSNPFMPQFVNPACCYPVLPICPVSYMQNVPSRSSSCTNCINKQKESGRNENLSKSEESNKKYQIETNEMIKEIYELVTQSPKFRKKQSVDKLHSLKRNCIYSDTKLTERGAGSARICAHNAEFGLPRTISKSCDAITPQLPEANTAKSSATYSDNILENLSLKATATECTSGTELSLETVIEKAKKNRFSRILQSFGIFKKKKKDVIEELNESEEEYEETMRKSPFQQNIASYMMHDQDYFTPPPVPKCPPDYTHNYGPHASLYNPGVPEYQAPVSHSNYNCRFPQSPHLVGDPYNSYPGQYPSAPPFSNSYINYSHMQPQVPLCLKEIEVKSIGCQSERKFSFFERIGIKRQKPVDIARSDFQKTCSTQTAQRNQNRPGFFGWSNLQSKSMNLEEPKTQNKLAQGDTKLKDAMLKKMFKKKNPFSPNNLLLRTLLGNEKSSYEPTKYRPRIFL